MQTNRRKWLKQLGIGIAGLSIAPLDVFASPSFLIPPPESGTKDTLIRLRANENPYGPSPLATAAMRESIGKSNRYGWEQAGELLTMLANKHKLSSENILMGAGSTEMLDLVAHFAALQKGNYVIAAPTFDYWAVAADYAGLSKVSVPLTADKYHDLPGMLGAMNKETRLVYICNPNNPTGTVCTTAALKTFIGEATKQAIVLLDEAYIDFTEEPSMSDLVAANKNLIVVRTFSKIYGLAGARVGYAIAHTATIEQLSNLQSAPNTSPSVVSVAGAMASLKNTGFVKEIYRLNEQTRQYTADQFTRLSIPYIPSRTNFLYFSLAGYGKDFFEQLKKNGILGTKIYEEAGKWSRITIGTLQEMQQFIRAIE